VPDPLQRRDIALVKAANPGPFTLDGTNTWIVGRDPCWIVDPGPALDAHVDAVLAEAKRRGGVGGIALTHDHGDHAGAAAAVREGAGTLGTEHVARACDATGWPPVGAARWEAADLTLADGDGFGPLRVVATPGHATDHLAFVFEDVCFTGDAVLAESSVFVAPDPGALRGYLAGLERLRERSFAVLLPGHGPPVADADARLAGYVAHRLERERALVEGLDAGARTTDELLDAAWSDVPDHLRLAASVTLAAHLDKLEEEGRLPDGVQRPEWGGASTLSGP
jgi:glyoxylase-like metal-dependent hydrolase (beta-lactamase superfamily II)